jgi:hypothetical protein
MSFVDLPTLTGDAVYTRCFEAKIILDGLKEIGDLLRQEVRPQRFDVMSG